MSQVLVKCFEVTFRRRKLDERQFATLKEAVDWMESKARAVNSREGRAEYNQTLKSLAIFRDHNMPPDVTWMYEIEGMPKQMVARGPSTNDRREAEQRQRETELRLRDVPQVYSGVQEVCFICGRTARIEDLTQLKGDGMYKHPGCRH